MGDPRETSSRYFFEKLAHEGIETKHIVHMPGLVTPISAVMVDPSGERTIVTFRDPELWKVRLPPSGDAAGGLRRHPHREPRRGILHRACTEAGRRGIPVVVDVDRAMSLREGFLNASTIWCSPANRYRRPPTRATTARH